LSEATRRPSPGIGDSIRETLETDILSGRLAPGDPLDERAVMARFGVSRTPVRQAMQQLQRSGLLAVVPRRGMVVTVMTSPEYDASLEVLIELECLAAKLAARRLPHVHRQWLQKALNDGWELALGADVVAYAAWNERFHALVHVCGLNTVLASKIQQLRLALRFPPPATFDVPGHLGHSVADHEHLVRAICEGDETSASKTMELHIRRVHPDRTPR
jgi:DNA-binding GntR family transcriptional regulator